MNTTEHMVIEFIGDYAFYGADFKTVVLPPKLSSISSYLFSSCSALTAVTIPSSVKLIGDYSFSGCSNLTDIYYNGTKAQWKSIEGIENIPQKVNVHFTVSLEPCFKISGTTVINTSNEQQIVSVIIARYDDKGTFCEIIKCDDETFNAGEEKDFPEADSKCKIFVWDDVSGMKPLIK